MNKKTITEFLSKEYRDYSLYTIESRAIPSYIDGFKVVHRKIIHASADNWKTGNEKSMKVFQLAGLVASSVFYHHGDKSLQDAIITLAQDFKNNLPLLEGDGQLGSLRSPESGAPRYVGAKLDKNFRLVYKDFELLTYKEEEGEEIEPDFFLPIIPMVLVNGTSGIAVAYASTILNRDPINILECCENILKGKKILKTIPKINSFNGDFIQDEENNKRWIIRGRFERLNTTTVKVTELPPSMTYEKYEKILDTLVDKKLIMSYDDNSKDIISYTVKFNRQVLSNYDDESLIKLLKLEESKTESFATLDENGKLKIFENAEDIIRSFVSFRLTYYDKRKDYILQKLRYELNVLSNRAKFIKLILDGKLKVNNRKKDDIQIDMVKFELDKIDGSYDYLLRMPIWSLTIDLFEKLKDEHTEKESEIKEVESIDPKDMYLKDLSELKKKLKNVK